MTIARYAAAALLFSIPLPAQSLSAVFEHMDATAQRFKSMSADIKRDSFTAIVSDHSLDGGTIVVKRDKGDLTRMLIDFKGKDAKTVAFDGKAFSIYYPKIQTVQVYDVGSKGSLVHEFLLLGFGATSTELQAQYDVTWVGAETVGNSPAGHIQLIPKSKEVLQHLKKAELWIDSSGMPVQQRFTTSAAGDYMLVTYSNLKLNPQVSDSSLKLTVPKGVKTEHPQF